MPHTHFSADDFVTLDQLGRAWRFNEPRSRIVPVTALQRIRPLHSAAARRLTAEAVEKCRLPALRAPLIDAAADEDAVRCALANLPIAPSTEIVVHWDVSDAVVTDWDFFVLYWSDFCYPSSDD